MLNFEDTAPVIDRTVVDIRQRVGAWRQAGDLTALVPTMGALHEGHLALVRAAKNAARRTVVSIFVNPTQFAPTEDLDTYPKNEEADLEALARLGVDAVFMPSAEEMYPPGFATSVIVGGVATDLETNFRPQYLTGVATVVTKLLLACTPDCAIFGEKDYQQLLVIRRMTGDLGIPTTIIGHATIRESDGLALSSRNAYLTPAERAIAPTLYKSLARAAAAIRARAPIQRILSAASSDLRVAGFKVDYVELRNAETLEPVTDVASEPLRLLAAAWLGKTRLIDNIPA